MEKEVRSRRGNAFFEKNFRPHHSSVAAQSIAAGYRNVIDGWCADVYLVSRADRNSIIGRPIVYFLLDEDSRCILGVHVGIQNASWIEAGMAILSANQNKVEFCAKYGLEITADEWPAIGTGAVILGDNGEPGNAMSNKFANTLGIDIETASPYRGDLKGVLERRFGIVPKKFAPFIDGYIEVDYKERGGKDYRLDAVLDIDEFTYMVLESVIEHNNLPIRDYELDVELVNAGVLPTPNQLWTWNLENRTSGVLRVKDDALLNFAVLPSSKARVTQSGLHFKGRRYTCDYVTAKKWQTTAARNGSWKVEVSYDPRNLDEIYLHVKHDRQEYKVCSLLTKDPLQKGLSMQEWLTVKRAMSATRRAYAVRELEIRASTQVNLKARNAAAQAAKASLGPDPRSNSERTKDIIGNRAREKAATRAAHEALKSAAKPQAKLPEPSYAEDDAKFEIPPIFKLPGVIN